MNELYDAVIIATYIPFFIMGLIELECYKYLGMYIYVLYAIQLYAWYFISHKALYFIMKYTDDKVFVTDIRKISRL